MQVASEYYLDRMYSDISLSRKIEYIFISRKNLSVSRTCAFMCANKSFERWSVNSTIRSTLWAARTFAQDYPKIYTPGVGNLKTCQLHFTDKLSPRIFRLKAALHPPLPFRGTFYFTSTSICAADRLEFTCGYI